jgi:hypothetical protein
MLDQEEVERARLLVREFGIEDGKVSFVSPRSPEAWAEVVRESDLAAFLHVSTFGHLAPYVQISMGLGCPTVVARAAQGEDLPEDVAFHIVPGMHEAAQFMAIVEAVKAGDVMAYGAPGRRYAQSVGDLTTVSAQLTDVLTSSAVDLSIVMERWSALGVRAQEALCEEVRGLVGSQPGCVGPDAFDEVITPSMRELGWGRV